MWLEAIGTLVARSGGEGAREGKLIETPQKCPEISYKFILKYKLIYLFLRWPKLETSHPIKQLQITEDPHLGDPRTYELESIANAFIPNISDSNVYAKYLSKFE